MPPPPSFGPGADLTPFSQRARARAGTKPLPTSFVFYVNALPPDFFAKVSAFTNWRIAPDDRVNGNAVATKVMGTLLYYCQFHISPEVRKWVMTELRTSGMYDGDLLWALVGTVTESRGWPRTMGLYHGEGVGEGEGRWVDEMYASGAYYTADGEEGLSSMAVVY
jgi:hypothetical protein